MYGPFGRTVGTTAAFVGGTAAAPIVGAYGLGAVAGIATARRTLKIAPLLAAGIGGAIGGAALGTVCPPAMGVVTAVLAYQSMTHTATTAHSPQTSDDEADTD